MPKTEIQDHGDRLHSEYGPSGFKHIADCAGYHGKEGTSEAAEKGTRIHEALEARDPSALHDEEEVEIYETITKMEEEFLGHFKAMDGEDLEDFDEIRLDIELNEGHSTFGTTDRFTHWPMKMHAVLGDYKSGVSVIDPAHKNWQGKLYLIGAFQAHPSIERITVVFYVPFHDGESVSEEMHHTFHRDELPDMIAEATEVLKEAKRVRALWDVEFGENYEPTQINGQPEIKDLNPTDSCRFCRYEKACPALGCLVMDVARKANKPLAAKFEFDPESTEPEEVAKRYRIAKIVEAWAKREKTRAVALVQEGTDLPGLRLQSMGSISEVTDISYFIKIAAAFGLAENEVLAMASVPFKKVAGEVGNRAPKKQKGAKSAEFIDACEDAGIIEPQAERFTLRENK